MAALAHVPRLEEVTYRHKLSDFFWTLESSRRAWMPLKYPRCRYNLQKGPQRKKQLQSTTWRLKKNAGLHHHLEGPPDGQQSRPPDRRAPSMFTRDLQHHYSRAVEDLAALVHPTPTLRHHGVLRPKIHTSADSLTCSDKVASDFTTGSKIEGWDGG